MVEKSQTFLMGKKLSMGNFLNPKNLNCPITVINPYISIVNKITEISNSNFFKVQIRYTPLNKKITGFKFKEFKVKNIENINVNQEFSIQNITAGDKIQISSKSIGKGNGSNIKRNNFQRGPMSHGSKHIRLQGSLGAGTTPGRVFPGKKMPGRLGGNLTTIKNLEIVSINVEKNIFCVKGSIPGKKNSLIKIVSTLKN
jgi:large subunit ribosomal protein L3